MYLSYTYQIICKPTDQFYYGSRCRNVKLKRTAKEDLWIYYFTSSDTIKSLRKLYNDDLFEFIILNEYRDYNQCYRDEQELIKSFISDPLCLNRFYTEGDKKKFSSCGSSNRKGKAGTPKTDADKKKMSTIMRGKSPSNKGKKIGSHTEEHKQNISNSISAIHKTKKEQGIAIGRAPNIQYTIIIELVKKDGFEKTAEHLNLSTVNLKSRYYYGLKKIKGGSESPFIDASPKVPPQPCWS